MNAIRNKVTLIGNLGNDPEMKETDGGYKLAKVSLATNESYKNNKGEKVTSNQREKKIRSRRKKEAA